MIENDIDWTRNCLTGGIHNGRPEAIWNIPLLQAALHMFRRDELKRLVIARIYNDALHIVEYSGNHTKEWAEKVKAHAESIYDARLQHKVGELTNYYRSGGWNLEQQGIVMRVQADTLNPHYAPLHPHDSINMLCRIIGVPSASVASV